MAPVNYSPARNKKTTTALMPFISPVKRPTSGGDRSKIESSPVWDTSSTKTAF